MVNKFSISIYWMLNEGKAHFIQVTLGIIQTPFSVYSCSTEGQGVMPENSLDWEWGHLDSGLCFTSNCPCDLRYVTVLNFLMREREPEWAQATWTTWSVFSFQGCHGQRPGFMTTTSLIWGTKLSPTWPSWNSQIAEDGQWLAEKAVWGGLEESEGTWNVREVIQCRAPEL